jgi:hypothetical protein
MIAKVTFESPTGEQQAIEAPMLGSYLFGPFYFVSVGALMPALVHFIASVCSLGLAWLIFPIFAEGLLRRHFAEKGWKVVFDNRASAVPARPVRRTAEQERKFAAARRKMGL